MIRFKQINGMKSPKLRYKWKEIFKCDFLSSKIGSKHLHRVSSGWAIIKLNSTAQEVQK